MEDKKLQKGIEEIKDIKMTALEKKRIFEYVVNSSVSKKTPVHSPWINYSLIARIQKTHFAYYVVVPLVLVLTSGGIVLASESSLPDSILYPVKVKIVEPIHGALILSNESKAHYETSLATKRMVEAEILAKEGKLDIEKENKLNALLVEHTNKLNDAIDKIDTSDGSDQVDDIVTNFQAKMNAHAKVLDSITDEESETDENTNEESDQNKIGIKENDEHISKSARTKADNIGDKFNNSDDNKEIKNGDKSDQFKKRKDNIKLIIDKTFTDINNDTNKDKKDKHKIISNTNDTLDQAQQLLDEADKKEQDGDEEDAYKTLLDSESSAKEANIFLNESLKLHDKDNEEDSND